jgi:uncharacterized membrane protein
MILLVLGLILFLAPHLFARSTGLRQALQGRFGFVAYRLAVSILITAGFFMIILGWPQARSIAPVTLWTPDPAWRGIATALTAPFFLLLTLPYLPGGKLKGLIPHPMMLAIILWSGAHLLLNGDLASALLFGGFFGWSVVARVLIGFEPRVPAAWSVWDAVAIVAGVGGWVLTALWLHPLVLGVPALAN